MPIVNRKKVRRKMICIVLAAGYATRLYPLTENFPKPLLSVGEKPLLNWLLEDIDQIPEVTEFVVISNHKFISHFESWQQNRNLPGRYGCWMMAPQTMRTALGL